MITVEELEIAALEAERESYEPLSVGLSDLVRLARIGLWAKKHADVIHSTLYSSCTIEAVIALEECPSACA